MIIHKKLEQRTESWYAIRRGIPTSSAADKILTPAGKLSTQSRGYMCQLIADLAGYPESPKEPTEHMLRGIELEDEARRLFEFENGAEVTAVGFVTNDECTAGFSPDGLIYKDGNPVAGFETKSPMAKTQIGYLLDGGLPKFYRCQVHFSLAVSGLQKWWFQSYYPGLDPLIVLVEPDDYTIKVRVAINEFTATLKAESERLGLGERTAA